MTLNIDSSERHAEEFEEKLKLAKGLSDTEPDKAMALLMDLSEDQIDNPLIMFLIGYIYLRAEKLGPAFQYLRRTLELAPHRWEAWTNVGRIYDQLDMYETALPYFEQAWEIHPSAGTAANMSVVHLNMGNLEEGLEWARKGLEFNPDDHRCWENVGYTSLGLHDWIEGWKGYEYGLGMQFRKEWTYGDEQRWDGTPGKTVVFYGEQGLGDEILFSSIIPDAIKDCKEVIIDCDSRLAGLFKRSFPDAFVYGTRRDESPVWDRAFSIDARCAMGSLPQFYRKADNDFPGTPYLKSDPERHIMWHALFESWGKRPKIGVAWSGGQKTTQGRFRYIETAVIEELTRIFDADFISLQYKDSESIKNVRHFKAIQTDDYDDTAALVANLDLVIGIPTTVIHLAGALGIPTLCLVPKYINWRFQREPWVWNKSVKLLRMEDNYIDTLVEEIRERLPGIYRGGSQATPGLHSAAIIDYPKSVKAHPDNPPSNPTITHKTARLNRLHF